MKEDFFFQQISNFMWNSFTETDIFSNFSIKQTIPLKWEIRAYLTSWFWWCLIHTHLLKFWGLARRGLIWLGVLACPWLWWWCKDPSTYVWFWLSWNPPQRQARLSDGAPPSRSSQQEASILANTFLWKSWKFMRTIQKFVFLLEKSNGRILHMWLTISNTYL